MKKLTSKNAKKLKGGGREVMPMCKDGDTDGYMNGTCNIPQGAPPQTNTSDHYQLSTATGSGNGGSSNQPSTSFLLKGKSAVEDCKKVK